MYCTNCGKQILEEAKFCTECGSHVPDLRENDISTSKTENNTNVIKSLNPNIDNGKTEQPIVHNYTIEILFFVIFIVAAILLLNIENEGKNAKAATPAYSSQYQQQLPRKTEQGLNEKITPFYGSWHCTETLGSNQGSKYDIQFSAWATTYVGPITLTVNSDGTIKEEQGTTIISFDVAWNSSTEFLMTNSETRRICFKNR